MTMYRAGVPVAGRRRCRGSVLEPPGRHTYLVGVPTTGISSYPRTPSSQATLIDVHQ